MEKAGMMLTASPTLNPSPPGPTAATVPAASTPMRAGKSGCSMYSPLRNIDSARLSPSALTLIWTSPFPGGGTSRCSIFRTSGPPVSWNRTTRVMAFSCLTTGVCGSSGRVRRSCRLQHGSRSAGQHQSGRELPDHDGGGVGVGRRDRGHDRGVGDAQALDAADAQLGVYHRFLARSHGAGTHRMEIAHAGAAKERQSLSSAHSHRRSDPAFDQVAEGRLRGDLEPQLDAGHQGVDVGLFRQEVGPDLEPAIVPRRLQPQVAPALRPNEGRHDAEAVGWDRILGGDLVRDKGDLRSQDHQVRPAERRPTLPEGEAAAEIVIRGGARVLGLEAEAVQPDVILEVSPHAREVDDGADAEPLEVSTWTDAGQQE